MSFVQTPLIDWGLQCKGLQCKGLNAVQACMHALPSCTSHASFAHVRLLGQCRQLCLTTQAWAATLRLRCICMVHCDARHSVPQELWSGTDQLCSPASVCCCMHAQQYSTAPAGLDSEAAQNCDCMMLTDRAPPEEVIFSEEASSIVARWLSLDPARCAHQNVPAKQADERRQPAQYAGLGFTGKRKAEVRLCSSSCWRATGCPGT